MKTTYLGGTTEGSVYIENEGALTVGDATAAKSGIVAGGEIILTAKSPVRFTEQMTAENDITVTSGDSADPGDDIVVTSSGPIHSTDGSVMLQAGDDLLLEAGSMVAAAGRVLLVCDFGNVDPDVGGRLFHRVRSPLHRSRFLVKRMAMCLISGISLYLLASQAQEVWTPLWGPTGLPVGRSLGLTPAI